MGIKIQQPDVEMVMDLANNLCEEDIVECELFGCSPQEACMQALIKTDQDVCWMATRNDVPLCMWGVHKENPPVILGKMFKTSGRVWMLMAKDVSKLDKFTILRESLKWVEVFNSHYDLLFNIADSKRQGIKKFLKFAGFDILDFTEPPYSTDHIYFVRCNPKDNVIH